jgi:hypothetical protein
MREVKIAQPGCGFVSIAGPSLRVDCHQVLVVHDAEETMLDFLFTLGQAASALLLLYGGFLVLMPERKPAVLTAQLEDELLLLKHIHTDA